MVSALVAGTIPADALVDKRVDARSPCMGRSGHVLGIATIWSGGLCRGVCRVRLRLYGGDVLVLALDELHRVSCVAAVGRSVCCGGVVKGRSMDGSGGTV